VTNQPSARFRATVHYDGTGFHGWQVQPRERTVQGDLEACLERLFGAPVRIDAAGRTDAGVHAVAQEIAFSAPARWSADDLRRASNAILPADIWIEAVSAAAPGFHPRFQATGRRYEYLVGTRPDAVSPLWARRLWAVSRPVNLEVLLGTSAHLIGEHDFAGLSKAGQPERGTRCRVEQAEWTGGRGGHLCFTILADRFLHHMVRYIVGTLVETALGRRGTEELEGLLSGDGDVRPPVPAPPCGLYLTGVRYGSEWNHPEMFATEPLDLESGTAD
jgi:tRNA pseudouridine38-40 synthase